VNVRDRIEEAAGEEAQRFVDAISGTDSGEYAFTPILERGFRLAIEALREERDRGNYRDSHDCSARYLESLLKEPK
jgi:hypothetical protein